MKAIFPTSGFAEHPVNSAVSRLRTQWVPQCLRAVSMACALAMSLARVQADDAIVADRDVAAVRPYVTESTFLVVKVDPHGTSGSEMPAAISAGKPEIRAAYAQWTAAAGRGLDWLGTVTDRQTLYATVDVATSSNRWPSVLVVRSTPTRSAEWLRDRLGLLQAAQVCTRGEYLVATPRDGEDVVQFVNTLSPSPRAELAAAFQAVESYPIQVLLLPPAHARRTVQELMPRLPVPLGGGPSDLLTDGFCWAAVGVDVTQLRAELIIQSTTDGAAGRLADYLPQLLLSLHAAVPAVQTLISKETAKSSLGFVEPRVEGSRIRVSFSDRMQTAEAISWMTTAAQSMSTQLVRQRVGHRLKQLVVAMHHHHDQYRSFPPRVEVRDAQGRSALSWRVHILPFLGEQLLYDQFHLDEPWDSPHNGPLLDKMPAVFKPVAGDNSSSSTVRPGYTTYLAPVGDDTVFGGAKTTRIRDIWDGTSNTVVLVEVKPELAVPWTAPDDYAFDPAAPAAGLLRWPDARFVVVRADSSLLEIPADLDQASLLGLFTKAKGELINWDKIR